MKLKGLRKGATLCYAREPHGSRAQGFQQVCERVTTHNQTPLLHIKIEFAGKGLREFLLYI